MNAGYGLTVRWSLEDAPRGAADDLREYVVGTSIARFMFLDGLAFKVWRMREGEWFEGTYVFGSSAARDGFSASFAEAAPTAPVSAMIGAPPLFITPFEVVAVAEGGSGFGAGPGPGA